MYLHVLCVQFCDDKLFLIPLLGRMSINVCNGHFVFVVEWAEDKGFGENVCCGLAEL